MLQVDAGMSRFLLNCNGYLCGFTIGFQYSKCLGNAQPKLVVCLEDVIWKVLFNTTCGKIDEDSAVQVIADTILNILENAVTADKFWFHLGLFLVF